jgi:LmbE family N-acetylglucosaminyl deacetylase
MLHSDRSLLSNPTALPLRSITTLASSPVLVVAPHPDDETLGCGGAIALLRGLGCGVRVLVISDGTMSHPRSRKYPAAALRELREQETRSALALLGVDTTAITFLRLKDSAVPTLATPGSGSAVSACGNYLAETAAQTVFLPWRYDPHADHRASGALIRAALSDLTIAPRVIEYPIWDWDQSQQGSLSDPAQFAGWRLDISPVVERKRQAIAAYRSQTTDLIDDDPTGFRLSSAMLANFLRPWEVYFEEVS